MSERPVPNVPEDRLLAELVDKHKVADLIKSSLLSCSKLYGSEKQCLRGLIMLEPYSGKNLNPDLEGPWTAIKKISLKI